MEIGNALAKMKIQAFFPFFIDFEFKQFRILFMMWNVSDKGTNRLQIVQQIMKNESWLKTGDTNRRLFIRM